MKGNARKCKSSLGHTFQCSLYFFAIIFNSPEPQCIILLQSFIGFEVDPPFNCAVGGKSNQDVMSLTFDLALFLTVGLLAQL